MRFGVGVALILLALGAAALAQARQSVDLRLLPVREDYLAADSAQATARPGPGEVLVLGRFDDPALAIESIKQIAVVGPDGRRVPLHVVEDSVYVEFDQIVSLRFYFLIGETETAETFALEWGADVEADNVKVARVLLDPAMADRCREFTWAARGAAAPGETTSVASIDVIADSSAEYHFLWYLLPMALIFLLLTIRKIRAHHPTT